MSELSKAYEPGAVEEKWYQFWLDQKCFAADSARVSPQRPAYSIVIPPPNVTGMLHMGHVLNNTIQDILARKARMDGKEVLWLPGTDHAGIATEGMVARQLKKEEKKSKQDIGREEFLKRVWAWKEKHGGIIIEQLKKLGCSCDWSRERFTMDPDYVRCVQQVFVDLYKKGLIYRGKRMVNWCPATQTALSDEEVEMKPQKGFMYHFKVEVADSENRTINRDTLLDVETESLAAAAKQAVGPARGLRCVIDRVTGDVKVFAKFLVSDHVVSRQEQIALSDARRIKADAKLGDDLEVDVTPTDFARIAAPFAKQALMEKIRSDEAEKAKPGIWLTIATTRPETIPGDTAVAVNPKDPRYAHLIGKHIIRPLPAELPPEQKLIPIVGDEHVDFEFGTGVLKVTPAHDKADFDIGQRHKLPLIEVINADGSMNALAGADLNGLDRFAARKVAVEKLRELGALVEEKPYENNVGFSQRADVPIEPRLSEQWFLKYPSVEKSKACVEQRSAEPPLGANPTEETRRAGARRSGGMRFHPDRWAKVYDHWLTNIQDWCISRQLWWGHQIPVWRCRDKRSPAGQPQPHHFAGLIDLDFPIEDLTVIRVSDRTAISGKEFLEKGDSVAGDEFEFVMSGVYSEEEARFLESEHFGFTRDPDVLDTWFSSWLWPFATMGWPEQTETLKKFYPTTDLVTGPDIIFFWVARMIMAGYEYMGEMPFRNVYYTGIIRDKQGRKMSKTLGNSPDPLELITKYGADALRFGTMRGAPLGQDVLFDEKDVELGRNFCNKLWNACRFRQMQGGEVQGEIDSSKMRSDDKWILLKLHQAIKELNVAFAEYNFSEAAATLYRFFWNEYCDWYVESSKTVLTRQDASPSPLGGERAGEGGPMATQEGSAPPLPNPLPPVGRGGAGDARAAAMRANALAVMDFVLSHTLRLFHPFLPFITEELWHGMGYAADMPADQGGRSIMFAPWPKPFDSDTRDFYALDDCYLAHVNARFELITKGRDLRRQANVASNKKVRFILKPAQDLPPNDIEVMKLLLNAEPFDVDPNYEPAKGVLATKAEMGELYLPLEGLVDAAAERARHTKELEEILAEIVKVEQKLANPSFVNKAPPKVLAEHRQRLEDWQAKRAHVQKLLDGLSGTGDSKAAP